MTEQDSTSTDTPEAKHRRIRSFVLRMGRMTSGQQRALDELWPRFGIDYTPNTLNLDTVFGRHAPRMIEIGFGIVPEMQGKGFGQELLLGMWKEIIKNPEVQVLRYTVSPENMTSLHIIEKFKFKKVGEQLDPEDGLELIFEMGKEEFQSLYGGDERI